MKNLVISTLTVIARLNTPVSLEKLYKQTELGSVIYVEYGCPVTGILQVKGERKEKRRHKIKLTKNFQNQVTMNFRDGQSTYYVKVFRNGSIHLTGLRSTKDIEVCLRLVVLHIRRYKDIVENQHFEVFGVRVAMMNANCRCEHRIKRDMLCAVMRRDFPNMFSCFDPTSYPGVKIHYNWNDTNLVEGVCSCSGNCNGKGTGNGDGQCNRTTIIIFRSGCCLIAGSIQTSQLLSAHKFAVRILARNKEEIMLNL